MARNHPESVSPHLGQIAYQRNDMAQDAATQYFGGGGCPGTNDVLINDLPFDFLQPQLRKQVTQVGYGGPFVIRSNPIGAIFDAIRNFCYPAPMEETGDGGYSDLSGMGLGTYGDYTAPMLGAEGYPYVGPYSSGTVAPPGDVTGRTCGTGTMWDATQQLCVPTPGMMPMANPPPEMDTCGPVALAAQSAKVPAALAKASNKDYADLCAISLHARQCETTLPAGPLKDAWRALANNTKGYLEKAGCSNCATCQKANPQGSPAMTQMQMMDTMAADMGMPPSSGMMPPPAGGSPGTDNMATGPKPNMSNQGSLTGPFAYIALSDRQKETTQLSASVATAPYSPASAINPPLPMTPDPGTFTEGNIYMNSSMEVMGGSFDPQKSIPAEQIRSRFAGNVQRGNRGVMAALANIRGGR